MCRPVGLAHTSEEGEHITSVRAMIEVLEAEGGLYLSPEVKAEALKIAGE
jgi:hypothetical protein